MSSPVLGSSVRRARISFPWAARSVAWTNQGVSERDLNRQQQSNCGAAPRIRLDDDAAAQTRGALWQMTQPTAGGRGRCVEATAIVGYAYFDKGSGAVS